MQDNKVQFEYLSVEPAHQQVIGEDGYYDAHVGWNIHAAVRTQEGHLDHYLHGEIFLYDTDAEQFKSRIEEFGQINLRFWNFVNRDHANRDYEREDMDIAWRERNGLPL